MYRRMLRIRRFEEAVAELMSSGQMVGSVHLAIGQEAAVVGACLALTVVRSRLVRRAGESQRVEPLYQPATMGALFGEGDAARLDRCAVLLRLAEDLERSRDQLVRRTSLSLNDGEVELRLIADGDSAVPRWAARREAELFARAFDRGLAVAA